MNLLEPQPLQLPALYQFKLNSILSVCTLGGDDAETKTVAPNANLNQSTEKAPAGHESTRTTTLTTSSTSSSMYKNYVS